MWRLYLVSQREEDVPVARSDSRARRQGAGTCRGAGIKRLAPAGRAGIRTRDQTGKSDKQNWSKSY